MATPEETMFEQVREAISSGEKARARDLLARLLRINANNPEYWLSMSGVVESIKERTFCLKEVLRLDPQNQIARRGLILIGELPVDESLVVPASLQKRNWEKQMLGDSIEKPPALIPRGVWIGAALLLVLVIATAVVLLTMRGPELVVVRPSPRTAEPTSTYMPTPSPVVRTATPTFIGPTPIGIVLQITYTPTPLYIATEHPRTESYRSAMSKYKLGEWDLVIDFLEQVLTPEPSAADVYFYLGEAHRFREEYSQAREAYQKAQEVNPGFAPGYYGEALIVMRNPEALEQAQELLLQAVGIDPLYVEPYLLLAEIALQGDNPQEAFDYLEQARAGMQWERPSWYLYRARANLLLDKPAEALQDALTAKELDQTILETYKVLGEAYQVNGDLKSSLEFLEIYLRYVPEDSEAILWLARAYRADGKYEQAAEMLSEILKADRKQFDLYLERGWIYLEMEEYQTALDDFLSYYRFNQTSLEVHLGLGRAYLGMEQYANAWQQFYDGLPFAETDAEKAEVYYWKSLALEARGDIQAAINDWYAMLALPSEAIPDEWEEYARQRLTELKKKVPTPVVVDSPTPSPSPTATRQLGAVTRTPTLAVTPTPPTPTKTP